MALVAGKKRKGSDQGLGLAKEEGPEERESGRRGEKGEKKEGVWSRFIPLCERCGEGAGETPRPYERLTGRCIGGGGRTREEPGGLIK